MTQVLRTGLLVLHGNRLEMLAEAVFAWLATNPLQPLEEEVFLVQSNGMAEWLKMEIASARGICAATRVELPARFIWRAYRAVLGSGAVPQTSALDKLPLTWRLMRLLPELASRPGFEPVAAFLGGAGPGGDAARRLQLAQRLADLLDQYQVYRSDWLRDWADGRDILRPPAGPLEAQAAALAPDQRWQPELWRALLAALSPEEKEAARADLHRRYLQALQPRTEALQLPGLPRRLVLFGTTHIPHQTLEAITALAAHSQVLMAVPNPCRYHWADIIDGRELLRAGHRRHAPRGGRDLSALPLQDMHLHGHPLLAAWGRQGRDFVRQLDHFDDAPAARQRFDVPRVDLFDDGPGQTLLQQVQAAIRDLVPLAEHRPPAVAADDRSIVFHLAHSAHREVEILHDQLLDLLAHPPAGRALNPRDVVVMVPDIDVYAPAIRAVFGQHARGQARHIPWGIADQKQRGHQPVLVALEWLLRAPQQRHAASEVQGLLDVPAVARRLGIAADDLPMLAAWIVGAGVRWGLNAAHRASLGLPAGKQNSWAFGLRRMLLGYATGPLDHAQGHAGIEPYAEVAGLSAALAGTLADLLQALTTWWTAASVPREPARWAELLRGLLADFFAATDDADRAALAALDDALAAWLQACELAGFDDDVDLAAAREAWLGAVDEPGAAQRFKAGGVTFCTLLPLRAIPFEVVCLLGMNDGDYPRRSARSDFDLMALPGQARPGDRSRRDDDRQLMLDALLSARRVLYVSWAGRSQRDNQEQPPSVLVSQLRDYLAAAWGRAVLQQRTTLHPLQPFSRRYFEPQAGKAPQDRLVTYAGEWRAAHVDVAGSGAGPRGAGAGSAVTNVITNAVAGDPMPMTIASLTAFVRNPVKAFFRHRLQVAFDGIDDTTQDDESFASGGLDRWALLDEVLRESRRRLDGMTAANDGQAVGAGGVNAASGADGDIAAVVQSQLARLQRAGRLPIAGPGRITREELERTLVPMVLRWQAARDQHPCTRDKLPARLALPDDHPEDPPRKATLVFDDWLVGLRAADAASPSVWIELQASKVADAGGKAGPTVRVDKLVAAWVRCLASAACGHPARGIVIGAEAAVHVTPPPQEQAIAELAELMRACHEGLSGHSPLPTAVRTGMALLEDQADASRVYDGSDFGRVPGERQEACLARLYPDYATLSAQTGFVASTQRLYEPYRQWLARHVQVELLPALAPHEAAGHD